MPEMIMNPARDRANLAARRLVEVLGTHFWPIMANATDGTIEVPVDGYIVTIKCEKIEDACPLCMGSGIMGRPSHPRRCRVCEGARKAPA